jgi:nitric oxide reductase subunit B
MNERHWWIPLLAVMTLGGAGVLFMGLRTYQGAPPIPDFVAPSGQVLATRADVLDGQAVFQKYALMQHGSMFGDGGARGPDYTASALHCMARSMNDFYANECRLAKGAEPTRADLDAIAERVRRELKENRWRAADNTVVLPDGQAHAYGEVAQWVRQCFAGLGAEPFAPGDYVTDAGELAQLGASSSGVPGSAARLAPGAR